MLLREIFKQLQFDNLCHTTEQFSMDYLGKHKNYYNLFQVRQKEPNIETFEFLYTVLTNKANSLKSRKYPYFVRTRNHLIDCCNQIQKHIQHISNN